MKNMSPFLSEIPHETSAKSILEQARPWMEDSYFDLQTQAEVQKLCHTPSELESAFFSELKFGTGGLRGIMGVGNFSPQHLYHTKSNSRTCKLS
jgi:hypothetical protein